MNCKKLAWIFLLSVIYRQAWAQPSLTIYNQDFAVVRQQVNMDLQQGTNEVQVTDISAQLEPDSVILRDPQGKYAIQILEQNYRADPVSQGLLLSLFEGKTIEFLTEDNKIIQGKIIRSGYSPQQLNTNRVAVRYMDETPISPGTQPVIEVDGKLRFSLPGEPLFPSLADDTILKPTINWIIQSDTDGKLDAELNYITSGMKWEADYSMLAESNNEMVNVIGWVTIENQTGKTFENARIKLMAGDVSKIRRADLSGGFAGGRSYGLTGDTVSEKAFEEYHLYTLNRQTTLHDKQTKQVEFLRADNVKAERLYVYDGANSTPTRRRALSTRMIAERDYGAISNPKVWVMRQVKNSKENNLGIPLPKGGMRFYQRDDDGQLEFIGESTIDHTPRDETIRVYTGNAFDLVGERKQLDYQIDTTRRTIDEIFEIKVRNRKEKDAVEFRVVEHLSRWISWEILQKSDNFEKINSQTIEFRVQVPAGKEKIVTYKVHYTW